MPKFRQNFNGGKYMNLGELREIIKDLPDEMEITVEDKTGGQDEALCAEICFRERGGLRYSEESIKDDAEGSDSECWELLESPELLITMR
jgi:hypothetical protein